ncbi:MAG: hypothetical protein DHS20C02_05200 [Micavibrio sp.]|nr:MAG: hypothetical protein DHS20C02_05200 [Micavibrio sp.]
MNKWNLSEEHAFITNDLHLVQRGTMPSFIIGKVVENFGFQKSGDSYLYRVTLERDEEELNTYLTNAQYPDGTLVSGYVDQASINKGILRLCQVRGHKKNSDLGIMWERIQADFGRPQDLDIRSNPAIEHMTYEKRL